MCWQHWQSPQYPEVQSDFTHPCEGNDPPCDLEIPFIRDIISKGVTRVGALDVQIRNPDEVPTRLMEERTESMDRVRKHRGYTLPDTAHAALASGAHLPTLRARRSPILEPFSIEPMSVFVTFLSLNLMLLVAVLLIVESEFPSSLFDSQGRCLRVLYVFENNRRIFSADGEMLTTVAKDVTPTAHVVTPIPIFLPPPPHAC
ncbi:hypothetical protein B0H14DRAFT_2621177 [Mycena olivaceomarginata]|nr:hypothetical protein B0H14DRAFT_2621177 [Mycena olivaceomarginata]